jgi:penicillin-binding protein 2
VLKRHVGFEERSRIEENKLEFPGVLFSAFPARTYPNQARLTHVLGYLRTVTDEVLKKADPEMKYQHGDVFGFSGLEHIYERILRGSDGVEFRLVDIYGIDHGEFVSDREYPAIPGDNFYVTIDSRLQILAESLMDGKKGAIIAMDPNSGDVLSYVSAPEYDLNSFVGPIPVELWDKWNSDPNKPLMNRTIQGTYPPGSIFKLIMAAYALENRIVSPNWEVQCNGAYTYGDRTFHCWNIAGHGSMDMMNSIKHSCNIFYYHLIHKIKFENWAEIVKEFGFSSKTGLDLPGEKRGIVPTRDYMNKKYGRFGWANGSLLNFVIGQGDVLATPLQVVQIMNLVATKGNTYQPRLNNSSISNSFTVELSTSTWGFLEDATFAVVNEELGTGRNAKSNSGIVRGKTSTAQNPHGEDHSWFSGYITLPAGEIMSLAVIVENGGKGSVEASKISRELFNRFAQLTENGSITLQVIQ